MNSIININSIKEIITINKNIMAAVKIKLSNLL